MRVYIGADHRGFDLKNKLREDMSALGIELQDLGPVEYDPDDDYNDTTVVAAERILVEPESRAVLLCGSGEGVMMQANRFRGIRAVDPRTVDEARTARWHHDANVLVIAAEVVSPDDAVNIVQEFLSAPFSNMERYINRIKKLDEVV